ncbi:MAG: hypothetical protein JXB88_24950 [Spirochaetales bacterium]|nr:hypothetical protein [Spirochaetales bacterium]
MEYYKLSRQYNLNINRSVMNNIIYTYNEKKYGGNFNQYSTKIRMDGITRNYRQYPGKMFLNQFVRKVMTREEGGMMEDRNGGRMVVPIIPLYRHVLIAVFITVFRFLPLKDLLFLI